MGHYTQMVLEVQLQHTADMPATAAVTQLLNLLVHKAENYQEDAHALISARTQRGTVFDHPFFQTRGWQWITSDFIQAGHGSISPWSELEHAVAERIDRRYRVISYFKNYDSEIQKLGAWLTPYLEPGFAHVLSFRSVELNIHTGRFGDWTHLFTQPAFAVQATTTEGETDDQNEFLGFGWRG